VVAGFDQAVRGMRIGGRRVVRCPPHKHWGRGGYADGVIAAREELVFHIRLLATEPSK
jgi:peptidylprolyl isomerase